MAVVSYIRKYRGIQITLTAAATKYSLYTLLAAVDANLPRFVRELVIQSDESNAGAKTLIGDVSLTTTRYGVKLLNGESRTYVYRESSVTIDDLYLQSDTNTTLINVELVDF